MRQSSQDNLTANLIANYIEIKDNVYYRGRIFEHIEGKTVS